MIRVAIHGATGRTGREVARAVASSPSLELVAALGRTSVGRDLAAYIGDVAGHRTVDSVDRLLDLDADVLVDFSVAGAAGPIVETALSRSIACVVGTTGIGADVVGAWDQAALIGKTAVLMCRNFSLGALLQARLSVLAAEVFPDIEIVELHGAHKRDRPSGTAAELAATLSGSSGNVPIHSVRLPGLVAHQEVLFGAPGEVLTLRHDVLSREAYVPGVLLAIRQIVGRRGVYSKLDELVPWDAIAAGRTLS